MAGKRKFKRKIPLFSPVKIAIITLSAMMATLAIAFFTGTDSEWHIVFGAVTVSIFICYLMITAAAGGRYRYSDKYIEIFYLSLLYKKLDYSSFSFAVISNASYNNGYGYSPYGNFPMEYRVKGRNGTAKVTFPFITLHKHQYPFDRIQKSMSSRDLFMLNSDEVFCLGICWFDSFKELLNYSDCNVYVLEDVYLRFKGQFDTIFTYTVIRRTDCILSRNIVFLMENI